MVVFDIARNTSAQLVAAGTQLKNSGANLRTVGSHLTVISPSRRRFELVDDFYSAVPTAELARYAPGDVIRCEQMEAYLLPGVKLKARALRLLFRSTGAVGEPTAVSGTLLLPVTRADEPLALVGYAPGTHGIADSAAPSRLLSAGRDWEATPIAHVLARGYAVAVPDYQGLGTPGDHVFMVGRVLGRNVLDVMRAAYKVAADEVVLGEPAGILGYSEGGAAAGWAAQFQQTYAPELNVVGVTVGAAPADMYEAVSTLDGRFASFFLAYGAIGYSAAYPELDLDPYLTPRGRQIVEQLRETNLFTAAWHGPRFAHAGELTDPNVLELPQWRARLDENNLGTIAPRMPVLLHHGRYDQIVAPHQSRQLLEQWRALGADVRLQYMRTGLDHVTAGLAGAPVALHWLGRRISGLPTSSGQVVVPLRAVTA